MLSHLYSHQYANAGCLPEHLSDQIAISLVVSSRSKIICSLLELGSSCDLPWIVLPRPQYFKVSPPGTTTHMLFKVWRGPGPLPETEIYRNANSKDNQRWPPHKLKPAYPWSLKFIWDTRISWCPAFLKFKKIINRLIPVSTDPGRCLSVISCPGRGVKRLWGGRDRSRRSLFDPIMSQVYIP